MRILSRWFGHHWGRLVRPSMRERQSPYYDRSHCVWPRLRHTSSAPNHMVCGEPVANTLDLPAVRTMISLLAGNMGSFPAVSAIGQLMVLPDMLGALTRGAALAPVCTGHLEQFWRDIDEALDTALPEDRERFNRWLKENPLGPKGK